MKCQSNNRKHKPNKVLMLIALLSALILMTAGCLQLPIEQRTVLNTLEPGHPAGTTLPVSDYQDDESSVDEDDNHANSDENGQETEDPANTEDQINEDSTSEDTDRDETTATDSEKEVISERPATITTEVELEGMLEEYAATLFVSQLGYSLYYIPERYVVFPAVGSEFTNLPIDEIWPVMPTAELPDMFVRLAYLEGMNGTEAAEYMMDLLQEDYLEISRPVTRAFGEDGYKTQYMRAKNGDQWDSELTEIYVIEKLVENHSEGSYILISTFFNGAAEGHGSRFSQMLNTFFIEP